MPHTNPDQINWELIIAVAAFVLSLYLSISKIYSRRKNLSMRINDYAKPQKNVAQFFISLEHHASAPLSLSSIQLLVADTWITCELEPIRIKEFTSGDYKRLSLTQEFPLNLTSYGGASLYIEFLNVQGIPLDRGITVSFRINSSRGLINKTVTLGNTAHYLPMT